MCFKRSFLSLGLAVWVGIVFSHSAFAYSYNLSAVSIYQQAKQQNSGYFQLLKRYPHAIDLADENGNTAYCLALRDKNSSVMNYLMAQGANYRHSCVSRIVQEREEPLRQKKVQQQRTQPRFKNDSFFDDDKNIWYTAGAIALIGGGIAAIASSGGGGGSGGTEQAHPRPRDRHDGGHRGDDGGGHRLRQRRADHRGA
jgi:hypothetical protein